LFVLGSTLLLDQFERQEPKDGDGGNNTERNSDDSASRQLGLGSSREQKPWASRSRTVDTDSEAHAVVIRVEDGVVLSHKLLADEEVISRRVRVHEAPDAAVNLSRGVCRVMHVGLAVHDKGRVGVELHGDVEVRFVVGAGRASRDSALGCAVRLSAGNRVLRVVVHVLECLADVVKYIGRNTDTLVRGREGHGAALRIVEDDGVINGQFSHGVIPGDGAVGVVQPGDIAPDLGLVPAAKNHAARAIAVGLVGPSGRIKDASEDRQLHEAGLVAVRCHAEDAGKGLERSVVLRVMVILERINLVELRVRNAQRRAG